MCSGGRFFAVDHPGNTELFEQQFGDEFAAASRRSICASHPAFERELAARVANVRGFGRRAGKRNCRHENARRRQPVRNSRWLQAFMFCFCSFDPCQDNACLPK